MNVAIQWLGHGLGKRETGISVRSAGMRRTLRRRGRRIMSAKAATAGDEAGCRQADEGRIGMGHREDIESIACISS